MRNLFRIFLILGFLCYPANKIFSGEKENDIPKLDNPVTVSYLKENLSKSKPRMVFNDEIVKDLREKIEEDPVIGNMYEAIRIRAFEILEEPFLERVQTGRRMLSVSRNMLNRINMLGVIYLVEKDDVLLERINGELLAVCNFSDWNPPHFLDVAEMSMAVALALDWTHDDLPESTIDIAKRSLLEKGIYPSWPEHGGSKQWWVNHENNWNQVCNGGMIAASIAIADEHPEIAAKTIKRSLDGLSHALKQYLPDGVYPEGPGYWTYGTSFSVLTASILETAFGTDLGHSKYPGFIESAMFKAICTSPSGYFYNFADCGDRRSTEGDVVLAWFATKTGNPFFFERDRFLMAPEQMNPDRLHGAALAWMSQYEQATYKGIPEEWAGHGDNPIAVFRKDDDGFYFAAKGGSGTVSHANLDAGSFIFELKGVRWSVDPGVQPYHDLEKTGFDLWSQCQDCDRWKLLTKSNFGHSTLTVNNQLHVVDGKTELTDFEKGKKPEVRFDLSPALKGQVENAGRTFVKKNKNTLLIEDDLKINAKTQYITWQMITVADVDIVNSGAILEQDGEKLYINNLSHPDLDFSVVSLDPPPLELDKHIENLKRIELKIPASLADKTKTITIRIELTGKG